MAEPGNLSNLKAEGRRRVPVPAVKLCRAMGLPIGVYVGSGRRLPLFHMQMCSLGCVPERFVELALPIVKASTNLLGRQSACFSQMINDPPGEAAVSCSSCGAGKQIIGQVVGHVGHFRAE